MCFLAISPPSDTYVKIKDPHTVNYKRLFAQAERYANMGSWEVDFSTDEVNWSDQYYRICGYQPNEIRASMEKTIEMVHPEDAVSVQTEYQRARSAGKPFHVEFRLIRADKEVRYILAEANIERNSDGAPARMVGIFMDITDRKHTLLKLEQQERRYEALIRNGFDGAAILKHDGAMTYLSPASEQLLGWTDDDTLDVTLLDIVHPADIEKLTKALHDALIKPNDLLEVDAMRVRHKNGAWLSIEGKMQNLLHMPGVEGIIFNFRSAGEKAVQAERRQLMEEIAALFGDSATPVDHALNGALDRLARNGTYKLREAWMVAPGDHCIELKAFGSDQQHSGTFYRETAKYRQLRPGECIAGAVWSEGRRMLINDIRTGNGFARGKASDTLGVHRVCGIPIRHNDETIGVLVMGVDENTLIPPQEMDFMEDVGRNIGAEIKRRTAQDDLNDLFELAPDLVALLSEDNELIRVNPAGCRLLQYPDDELKRAALQNVLHPDDTQAVLRQVQRVRDKLVDLSFEARVLTREGRILWMEFSASISAGTGHTFLMGRDITLRRQLENMVEQASKLSRIGAWEMDVRKDTVTWSDITRDIFGVARNFEPTAQSLVSLVRRGVSRGKLKHALDKSMNDGEGWDVELEIVTGTGQPRWIRMIAETETIEGEVVRIFGSVQDIHERKVAEITAQEVSEEKDLILSSISDAFYALDEEWRFIYVNRKAEEIFGRSAGFLRQKTIWDMPGHHNNPGLIPVMEYVHKHRVPRTAEYHDDKLNAWFELSIYPYGKGLSVYFRDVTERRRVEAELHQLSAELAERAREMALSNAELEQFAFVASHDLQEPLRMITGFMDRLEKRYGTLLDDRGKRYIHFATDAAKRMREIILDLLEFSRIDREESSPEEFAVADLLEEILTANRRYISDNNAFIEYDRMPHITAHKGGLYRVFQCLLNNAIKYSKRDGVTPRISITTSENGTHWQFSISDNGIGIDPAYFDEIFVLFRRLHSKDLYTGSGMGLPIAKKVVTNHGGSIWVESTPDKGSTFHFTIAKPQLNG